MLLWDNKVDKATVVKGVLMGELTYESVNPLPV